MQIIMTEITHAYLQKKLFEYGKNLRHFTMNHMLFYNNHSCRSSSSPKHNNYKMLLLCKMLLHTLSIRHDLLWFILITQFHGTLHRNGPWSKVNTPIVGQRISYSQRPGFCIWRVYTATVYGPGSNQGWGPLSWFPSIHYFPVFFFKFVNTMIAYCISCQCSKVVETHVKYKYDMMM